MNEHDDDVVAAAFRAQRRAFDVAIACLYVVFIIASMLVTISIINVLP